MCSGNNDLGALACISDLNDIDLDLVALSEDFAADLLGSRERCFCLVSADPLCLLLWGKEVGNL